MDWIHAHLVVNHGPVILALAASLAAIVAALSGRESAWRYAATTGVLAAVSAPIAFLTGQRAEEVAEAIPRLSEEAIETHEHWGLYALIALGLAGLLAILALVRRTHGVRWIFAIGLWGATGVGGAPAYFGGEIEHPAEARRAPPGAAVEEEES